MNLKHTVDTYHKYIDKYYRIKEIPRHKAVDRQHVLTVSAYVSPESFYCVPDQRGTMHQHFFVNIKEVVEGDKNLVDNNTVFVAVHYGDPDGIAEPIPNLDLGHLMTIKGKFVPAKNAYKTEDNPGYPVLHFTHHPIGYIIYEGIKYE